MSGFELGKLTSNVTQITDDRFGKKDKNAIADKLWASGVVGKGGFSAERLKLQKEMAERTGNTQLFAVTSALLGKLNSQATSNPIKPANAGTRFDTADMFSIG